MNNKIIGCLLLMTTALNAVAQSGTSSPYSQYGLGILTDPSQGGNRGMNGVGIGLRHGKQINTLNPASYAVVDSMTMLFDMGLSGQLTHFKEGGTRVNAQNGNFEYAVGAFRATKGVGVSFGLLPLTNVGYDYTSSQTLTEFNTVIPTSYKGSGGLHQAFVGAGWQVLPHLSVGANVGYMWGTLTRSVTTTATTTVNAIGKVYSATVANYKVDLGAQWEQPLNKQDVLSLGAIVGIGHHLNADAGLTTQVGNGTPTVETIENALALPMSYGVGLSFNHARSLTVALDGQYQKWGALQFPQENSQGQYVLTDGLLKDRVKVTAGVEWLPNPNQAIQSSSKLYRRIYYRAGLGYATPYYNINGQSGPKEISASVGLGIPMFGWMSRSFLNISGQWAHTAAPGLITENIFRLNIGITFNERWFAKWKVE